MYHKEMYYMLKLMAYLLIYLKRFRSRKGSHFVVSFSIYPT